MEKGSKYINVRYFFVVDKVEKREVRIAYCPTEKIVADFSTKSLQGKVFVLHCDTILGIIPEEFDLCKKWHEESFRKHYLWDYLEYDLSET